MSSYQEQANAVSNILTGKGDALANAAANKGQIWGSTVANLGQVVPQQVQQAMQQVAARKQAAAEEQKKQQIQQIFQQYKDDLPMAIQQVTAIDPELGMKLGEQHFKIAENAYKFKELRHKADLEAVNWELNTIGSAVDEDTYAHALLSLREAGQDVSKYPAQYDPKVVAQANRSLLSAKERLEMDKPKEPKAPEPFTLSPGQVRFGAGGEQIANVPATAGAEGGFTLSPGGRRYDAAGKLIASAPESAGSGQEPLVAVMGPDGKPVLVRRSQAEGKAPASNREQGRNVTSGDVTKITDLDSSLNDLQTLKGTVGSMNATGTSAAIGAALPNWATNLTGWGTDAKKKQAVIDRVKQVIGKALEGGVLRKEDELKYERILPTISDPPPVVAAKLKGLEAAIAQRRTVFLDNLEDANYDTSRYRDRAPAPAAAPATKKANPFR